VRAAFYGSPPRAHVDRVIAWLSSWWRRTRAEPRTPAEIVAAMQRCNPKFVLRNWVAQQAIDQADGGDFTEVERLLRVMQRPFDEQPDDEDLAGRRPEWARHRPGCSSLSCSS
jgi:uncharacterized protein YdiU (UPF0061 family)